MTVLSLEAFGTMLQKVFDCDSELNRIPLEQILDRIPRVDEITGVPEGSTVLVRVDLDMPVKDGKVKDMSRIEANSPTIEHCHKKGWKTVIFGHLGRDRDNSVEPVRKAMSDYLGIPIQLVENWLCEEENCLDEAFVKQVKAASPGTIFMLQNTRKYTIEQALWKADVSTFSGISERMYAISKDILDRLATVEVNESIAGSNIDFSSSVVPLLMSKTALGFYITDEMKTHIRDVRKANCVVFSGLKIDKLDALEGIVDRGLLTMIIAAGSLSVALRKARAQLNGRDFFIGLAETDPSQKAYINAKRIEQGKRILRKCEEVGVDVVLPVDSVLDSYEISEVIPEGHLEMDIGPKSCSLFARKVNEYIEASKVASEPYIMFHNGVFGKFEDPRFETGTKTFIPLLGKMTKADIRTYVGGGEGRLALIKYGSLTDVTHAFTCGGTVLKSMTNEHIAYLKAMYLQNTI